MPPGNEVDLRILVITSSIPYPTISGSKVRSYNLLRRVAAQHQVSLAALTDSPEEIEGVSHMREFCHRVKTAPVRRRHPLAHLPGLLRYAVAGRPLELKFVHSQELARHVRHLVSTEAFDIVQMEPAQMALYLETLPPHAHFRHVLMFHNISFNQYYQMFRFEGRPGRKLRALLHSLTTRRWEPSYAERFHRCITVSKEDRQLLLAANPRLGIDVIPNGVDTRVYQFLPKQCGTASLAFFGAMSYSACSDAVLYFCREMLPVIRRTISDLEMWIVGTNPSPEVIRLGGDGVHVTGRVDSIVPYYRQSSVCVVPLRIGGGSRLKILEAMALGRPVVSTSVGAEGLDVVDGEHILIADSPGEFARKTVRLLEDRALYGYIATNARQLVVARYDWDVIAGQLMQVYAGLVN